MFSTVAVILDIASFDTSTLYLLTIMLLSSLLYSASYLLIYFLEATLGAFMLMKASHGSLLEYL